MLRQLDGATVVKMGNLRSCLDVDFSTAVRVRDYVLFYLIIYGLRDNMKGLATILPADHVVFSVLTHKPCFLVILGVESMRSPSGMCVPRPASLVSLF